MTAPTVEHGYISYTHGCRCQICRSAKATYMRDRRRCAAQQRAAAAGTYVADGIVHGYGGYQNHACRCAICREARSFVDSLRVTTRYPGALPRSECGNCGKRVPVLRSGHLRAHHLNARECPGTGARTNRIDGEQRP